MKRLGRCWQGKKEEALRLALHYAPGEKKKEKLVCCLLSYHAINLEKNSLYYHIILTTVRRPRLKYGESINKDISMNTYETFQVRLLILINKLFALSSIANFKSLKRIINPVLRFNHGNVDRQPV